MPFIALIMDKAALMRALKRISHEILERNGGSDNLCIIGIKRKGVPLAKIIADNINEIEGVELPVGSLDITMHRDDIKKDSDNEVVNSSDIPFSIAGKKVIMVDDVLFTGRTARAAMEALIALGRPSAIQFAVLIDRGHRELPIRGDYVGKNIPTSLSEEVLVKVPDFDDEASVCLYSKDLR